MEKNENSLMREVQRLTQNDPMVFIDPSTRDYMQKSIQTEINKNRFELIVSLFWVNLGVLGASSFISYALARYTIRPMQTAYEQNARFTQDASHELKTPLTAMRTEIEVALETTDFDANTRELLQSNIDEIQKMTDLTTNLMRLSNSENSGLDLKNVDALQTIVKSAQSIQKLIQDKNVTLDISNITDANKGVLMVRANAESLSELWTILLENAVKYSALNRPAYIKVIAEQNANYAYITVMDNGIGIDQKDISNLFYRFYRAEKSHNKDVHSGYGIGLSIAKSIVDKNHGIIEVKSKPDLGTSFRVRLQKAKHT
jgi:signal transduction histidine kinase